MKQNKKNSKGQVRPLEGIRVLECTFWQVGPICTAMLADLGADVIKVEPLEGSPARAWRGWGVVNVALPFGRNAMFEVWNRNKRGIVLDLKKKEGRAALYSLVRKSDVFVQNFRPGKDVELGIDYETLRKINPRLIYGSSSALGTRGPEANKAGFDAHGQARAGLMYLFAEEGCPPAYGFGAPSDLITATMLSYGILAALHARNLTNEGQRVDVSLLSATMWLNMLNIGVNSLISKFGKGVLVPFKRKSPGNPLWNYYECRDGKWIHLGLVQSVKYWKEFCQFLGRPELENDPRFCGIDERRDNSEQLVAIIDEFFKSRTRDELEQAMQARNFIYERIQKVEDLPNDPQVIANEYLVDFEHPTLSRIQYVPLPFQLSATPPKITRPAPEFKENTEEVLIEIGGYTWEQLAELREKEVF